MRTMIHFVFLTLILGWAPQTTAKNAFDPGRSSFEIMCRQERSAYRIQSVFFLPGEQATIQVLSTVADRSYKASLVDGNLAATGANNWTWTVPREAGYHVITIGYGNSDDQIQLNVFVMEPFSSVKNGALNGFQIGNYPEKPLRNNPIYLPPRGFVPVTEKMMSLKVSPHFTLGQFICKQAGGFPKYLVLRSRLLFKLEYLLERVNSQGIQCESFFVMSGFRTPFYNKAIGNVKYSRHQWGGAADIFVDESPRDGYPDDLNKDGKINHWDAMVLYELVDGLSSKSEYKPYIGGLGRYRSAPHRGPFVHVDVRGFKARWGE